MYQLTAIQQFTVWVLPVLFAITVHEVAHGYIANKFGVNVEIGNAWRNVTFPADRQNELLTVSNYFSVAAGLAEREE